MNYSQPPPPPQMDPNAPKDRKVFAIVSMICGIISVVFSCAWYLAIILAIVAIVLGCMSLKSSGKGMAIAGIICGGIGVVASIVFFVLAIGLIASGAVTY